MELKNLIEDDLIFNNDRVAVGVSGGADSMLLLSSLKQKQKDVNFYLKVINVNHGLRGAESDADSKFVENFCKENDIDEVTINVDVKKLKNAEKKTLEETARNARYDAIFSQMKKDNLTKLFVAHHKNDQAETILMNIFRGCGMSGASGIKSQITISGTKICILRPFLKISKSEILSLCKENRIKFVTDSSNLSNDTTRNYIRNVVLPQICEIYPNAVNSICDFGQKASEVQNYIQSQMDFKLIEELSDGVLVKETVFFGESLLEREYFKKALESLGVFQDIEAKHFASLSKLKTLPVNSVIELPHKINAKRTRNGIKIYKKTAKNQKKSEYEFVLGELLFEKSHKIKTEIVPFKEVNFEDGNFYADYMKIPQNAVWRHRQIGDTFSKLGSLGEKKFNDYLTDKKVDVDVRDDIILLASENKVLMALGLDIGDSVKITPDTDQIIKISFDTFS